MRFKCENKGFSLVELIVVIAIFSVVGIVVGGFLFTASRSYSLSANELDLQEEAQLVANQIQEMLLDTSYGIAYQFVGLDEEGNNLIKYMENDAAALPEGSIVSQKDLYIYGKDQYYYIYWDKEAAQILLKEYTKNDEDKYVPVDGMPTDGVLFGEYISDFKVDLSKVVSNRMVTFNITFKKDGSDRDYMVTRTVSLRNDVLTNKPREEIYQASGEVFQPAADKMDISPDEYDIWPGETLNYNVLLQCTEGGVPSQQVQWTLNPLSGEPLDANTKINFNNILTVGENEKNSQIEVVATTKGYDYVSNKEQTLTETCKVNVRQITDLSIISTEFNDFPAFKGGRYEIKVKMEGNHLENLEDSGGIYPIFIQGGTYATISEPTIDGMIATYTVDIKEEAKPGDKIEISFRPKRLGYTHKVKKTDVYEISDSEQVIFSVKGSGKPWLRLGTTDTQLEFKTKELEKKYTDPENNKKLAADHYIKYTYKIYGSDKAETSYGTVGNRSTTVLTDCFNAITFDQNNDFSVNAELSDKVFLQSGQVVVSAELVFVNPNTAKEVTVGKSDELTYEVPAVSIRYKRAKADVGETEMKSYVTKNNKNTTIYIDFAEGYATDKYKISKDNVKLDKSNLGSYTVNESERKITFTGSSNGSNYGSDKKVVLSYGDIPAPNVVTIYLRNSNVSGTSYYVPVSSSEWTKVKEYKIKENSKQKTVIEYEYYIDENHKMEIKYKEGKFNSASLCELIDIEWNKVAYKKNNSNWTKVG